MIYGELNHPSHPHRKLVLVREETPYTCDRCHRHGFYTRYKCPSPRCDYHLHKDCAHAIREPKIKHPFFPDDHVFHFRKSPVSAETFCSACGRHITGYNYHCYGKDLSLHPSCRKLPKTVEEGDVRLELRPEVHANCSRCGEKAVENGRKGWSYVSRRGGYHLHPACIEAMFIEKWERRYLGRDRGGRDGRAAGTEGTSTGRQIVRGHGNGGRDQSPITEYVRIAATSIIAAFGGHPVALVVHLISRIFSD